MTEPTPAEHWREVGPISPNAQPIAPDWQPLGHQSIVPLSQVHAWAYRRKTDAELDVAYETDESKRTVIELCNEILSMDAGDWADE